MRRNLGLCNQVIKQCLNLTPRLREMSRQSLPTVKTRERCQLRSG